MAAIKGNIVNHFKLLPAFLLDPVLIATIPRQVLLRTFCLHHRDTPAEQYQRALGTVALPGCLQVPQL